MIDRRKLVTGGASSLMLGQMITGAPVAWAQGNLFPSPVKQSALKAIVQIGGRRLVYDSALGRDMGPYIGEFVKQHCVLVTLPDFPLTVFFRPDVNSDRVEVVVELGRMWGHGPDDQPSHIVAPYTVEIVRGEKTLATVDVPYHWWWSRWRWQSEPRPLVRSVTSLMARKLLPPLGRVPLINSEPHIRPLAYSGPMDRVSLLFDGSTGERAEIGPVTEAQADYIINGSDAALRTMLAQAEACGSAPIHWRDEKTGTFINMQQYPTAATNVFSGHPIIPRPPKPKTDAGKDDPRYMDVETSHTPALAYVPYLLTDDPYLLEEQQALGTLAMGFTGQDRGTYKLPGLVTVNQTRGFAWSIRSLFQLGVMQPAQLPSWLLPTNYWKKCVADNLVFMHAFMNSPAKVNRVFHQFPMVGEVGPWQNCFISFILAWALQMGYSEWREAYDWHLQGIIPFVDGKSGWNRQYPTPYFMWLFNEWPNRERKLIADQSLDSITLDNWLAAWEFFKAHSKIDDVQWDGHTIMDTASGPAYLFYLYGVLKMASSLGHPEAKLPLEWLETEIPRAPHYPNAAEVRGFAKWSVTSKPIELEPSRP